MRIILLIILAVLLCGCRSHKVVTESEYIRRDSLLSVINSGSQTGITGVTDYEITTTIFSNPDSLGKQYKKCETRTIARQTVNVTRIDSTESISKSNRSENLNIKHDEATKSDRNIWNWIIVFVILFLIYLLFRRLK